MRVVTISMLLASVFLLIQDINAESERYPLRGQVSEVIEKNGKLHVKINIGKDQGVIQGMIFHIHRGNQFLGKVKVKLVGDDFSTGEVSARPKRTKVLIKDHVITMVQRL